LSSQTYGVVIRAQDTCTEVDYHIDDNNPNNDDITTGQNNGNGNGSNGMAWATATMVSPLPPAYLGACYPNYPREYRFNYVGIRAAARPRSLFGSRRCRPRCTPTTTRH
jgi:hypothetical protein